MITSYDQLIETYRGLCRETLELSMECWLGAATINSAAMKVIDAALSKHTAAIEQVNAARDVEDLFDLHATLVRDCVEECLQHGTQAAHSLYTEQTRSMQELYSNACRVGALHGRLLRFATTWPQPLLPLWKLIPNLSNVNPWLRFATGAIARADGIKPIATEVLARKAS